MSKPNEKSPNPAASITSSLLVKNGPAPQPQSQQQQQRPQPQPQQVQSQLQSSAPNLLLNSLTATSHANPGLLQPFLQMIRQQQNVQSNPLLQLLTTQAALAGLQQQPNGINNSIAQLYANPSTVATAFSQQQLQGQQTIAPNVGNVNIAPPPQNDANQTQNLRKRNLPPGATVKCCRARGVSADHTIKTAYFIIRKDIAHGEDLICSHPECQKRGPRFCYCAVCRTPVAKQNFSTRHRHDDTKIVLPNKEKDDGLIKKAQMPTIGSSQSPPWYQSGSISSLADAAAAALAAPSSSKVDSSIQVGRQVSGSNHDGSNSTKEVNAIQDESQHEIDPSSTTSSSMMSSSRSKEMLEASKASSNFQMPPSSNSSPSLSPPSTSSSSSDSQLEKDDRDEYKTKARRRQRHLLSSDTSESVDDDNFRMPSIAQNSTPASHLEDWVNLLCSRPNSDDDENGNLMSSWLMQVMAISDSHRQEKNGAGFNTGHEVKSRGNKNSKRQKRSGDKFEKRGKKKRERK